jgi:hypothetical protein
MLQLELTLGPGFGHQVLCPFSSLSSSHSDLVSHHHAGFDRLLGDGTKLFTERRTDRDTDGHERASGDDRLEQLLNHRVTSSFLPSDGSCAAAVPG